MTKVVKVIVKPETKLGVVLKQPKVSVRVQDGTQQIAGMVNYFQTLEASLVNRVQYPVFIQRETPPDVPGLWITLDANGNPESLAVNTGGITN